MRAGASVEGVEGPFSASNRSTHTHVAQQGSPYEDPIIGSYHQVRLSGRGRDSCVSWTL